jgi:hypothetical protein
LDSYLHTRRRVLYFFVVDVISYLLKSWPPELRPAVAAFLGGELDVGTGVVSVRWVVVFGFCIRFLWVDGVTRNCVVIRCPPDLLGGRCKVMA